VNSAEEILEALAVAENRRAVEETKMNAQSSRSHCLFSVTVTSREYCSDGQGGMVMERTGRLNLVDLAGSECAKTAGTGNDLRGLERKNINQSLLALGRVITALQSLSNSGKGVELAGRVPYRDSKLTRLLQDALGGRSKTTIVATCSPSELAVEETVSTLGYAQRASGNLFRHSYAVHAYRAYCHLLCMTLFAGITNRPAQNQLMSGSGRSLSPGPGAVGSRGGSSTQDWRDLETRLQYMDNQVREAQYELARQHELQKEASARAASAEDLVGGLEDTIAAEQAAVARADERVALLHRRLGTRHVHVAELRHLLSARTTTENALRSHAESLIGAVRNSISLAESLQSRLEANASEDESRRVDSVAYVAKATAAGDAIRSRSASYLVGHKTARANFAKALTASCEATGTALQGLTQGLDSLKERVAAEASAVAEKVQERVRSDAATATEVLASTAAGSSTVAAAVKADAMRIDTALETLLADTTAAEERLVAWANDTGSAATVHADDLRWRAEQEAALVAEGASAMEERHQAALDAVADDTAAIEMLLGGLAEHAAANKAHSASAAAASAAAANALKEAQEQFRGAAKDLSHTMATRQEEENDTKLLAQLSSAASAISDAATRQTAALSQQAAEVDAAREAVLKLVQEQKEAQATLVESVVAAVRQSVEAQSAAVCSKLDSAAAAVSTKHSALAASNTALATDTAETFAHLASCGEETTATAETWQATEQSSGAVVERTINALTEAQYKASQDASNVAQLHANAAAESSDLTSRTEAEEAAVAALRDSSLAATRAGEVARAATAAAMEARASAVAEWKAADVAAAAETLASLEALQTEVRAEFLPHLGESVASARRVASEELMATLRAQLQARQAEASKASEARGQEWDAFGSTITSELVGIKGLAPGVATDCDRMLGRAAAAAEAEATAATGKVERLAALGDDASALDNDVASLVAASREDLLEFSSQVLRVDTPVPFPEPLPPTPFSDQVAMTRPHQELLNDMHGGDGDEMEAAMFQRVSALLDLHSKALQEGKLPFSDPSELDTCENDFDDGRADALNSPSTLRSDKDEDSLPDSFNENGIRNPLL